MFPFILLLVAQIPSADQAGIEFFESRIRPVLVEHCYECHSSKSKTLEGNLSLEFRDALLKGGEHGPAIVAGDPEKSALIRAIRYADESLQMPPNKRLPDSVIADFETWIKQGAPDPRLPVAAKTASAIDVEKAREQWTYKTPSKPSLPTVKHTDWPTSPIDHFILAKLEQHELTPVSDADKRTLIRRATYDLTGLPPAGSEIEAFLFDDSPSAFAAVVDRLLASPRYGERWGRHWLDVVRYADTAGDNSDYPVPQMYLYRNWVINAWNKDVPYDYFVRTQLAGDLLPSDNADEKYQQTIATGYIANARRFGSRVDDYPQHLTIEDTIDNLGKTFLGLTINCARCHNHKFDPITTEDYYALYGLFHSTRYPWPGIELDKRQRNLVALAPAEQVSAVEAERQEKLKSLTAGMKQEEREKAAAQKKVDEITKQLEQARKEQGGSASLLHPPSGRVEGEERAFGEGEAQQAGSSEKSATLQKQLTDAKQTLAMRDKSLKAAQKLRDDFDKSPLPYAVAYAVAEGKKIEDVAVQIKGDPERKGTVVARRTPVVFGAQTLPHEENESGRRQLADWIVSPANPLTARVMMNRLWHYHIGQGIVSTPNDFGRQGKPPSHPELLDYLAVRFVESGWSLKAMHRLILLSHTYQLSSQDDDKALQIDPANVFLWRANRRRLDAESIRDSLLFLADDLDLSVGGEHPFPPQKDWNFTQHNPFKAIYDTNRRSVYLMTQRIQRHPYLTIFDGPDTSASTANRITSTTTLQALYLLNDQFLHDRAAHLVQRLCDSCSDQGQRVQDAFELVLGRPATPDEISSSLDYISKVRNRVTASGITSAQCSTEAWNSLIRVLFRTNEFIYLN